MRSEPSFATNLTISSAWSPTNKFLRTLGSYLFHFWPQLIHFWLWRFFDYFLILLCRHHIDDVKIVGVSTNFRFASVWTLAINLSLYVLGSFWDRPLVSVLVIWLQEFLYYRATRNRSLLLNVSSIAEPVSVVRIRWLFSQCRVVLCRFFFYIFQVE
jgi:hypothetical protein